MPAIRNTISLPKPENALLKGITPKTAIAIQANIDVVAIGKSSEIKRIISKIIIINAIVLGSAIKSKIGEIASKLKISSPFYIIGYKH